MAYRSKWLPHAPDTIDTWSIALFLEQDYWENLAQAVAAGISKAMNGQ